MIPICLNLRAKFTHKFSLRPVVKKFSQSSSKLSLKLQMDFKIKNFQNSYKNPLLTQNIEHNFTQRLVVKSLKFVHEFSLEEHSSR